MKILLTGRTGQIGGALLPRLGALGEVHAPTRDALDLADHASLKATVEQLEPDLIVNAAGYTRVDDAESDRDAAFAANADGPEELARLAAATGATLVHYSTDYVFSGDGDTPWKPTDPPNPVNVYGESKLAGEQAIAASGCNAVIIRTSWIYDLSGRNFVTTIRRLAAARDSIQVVNDQTGAPTWSCTVAEATIAILQHEALDRMIQGDGAAIVHLAAAGQTTWFDFAHVILTHAGLTDQVTLEPVSTDQYNAPAPRPRYSVLDCGETSRAFGFTLPDWDSALATAFAKQSTGGAS